MEYIDSLNIWNSSKKIHCDACWKNREVVIQYITSPYTFNACFECICNEKNHFEKLYQHSKPLIRCLTHLTFEQLQNLEKKYIFN